MEISKEAKRKAVIKAKILLFFIFLFLLFQSISIFYKGFHNVDLSYNFALITNDINQPRPAQGLNIVNYRDLEDTTLAGIEVSYVELYALGISQMLRAFALGILAMGGLISTLFLFPTPQERREKYLYSNEQPLIRKKTKNER